MCFVVCLLLLVFVMSFRWFIYYCSLCGGCAAYLGWVMGRIPPINQHVIQAAVKGMFLGMTLAGGLTLVDVVWNQAGGRGLEACWRLLTGGCVGGVGGVV